MRIARAFLVVIAAASSATAQPTSIMVRGTVVDDEGAPIVNARVAAQSLGPGANVVMTDDAGRFTVTTAPRSSLTATKTGYGRRTFALRDTGDAVVLRLQRGAAVSGRVIDTFGDPIFGARI